MITSNIKKTFLCNKEKIWNVITDNENYQWREDLSKIDIVDEDHFIEYAKNGFPTYFTITKRNEFKEYCLSIENSNISGKWVGCIHELNSESVELDFTEEIEVKNLIMKLFAKFYLKSMQKKYMANLENYLKGK